MTGYSNIQIEMEKPFNPILGETFQGWVNGCPVYCEQISHHPAISNFLMIGRGYRVFGTFEPKVNLRLNTACGSQMGEYTIQFDRYATNSVRFQMMTCEIHGVTYG